MAGEGYPIRSGPCRADDPDAELVARVVSGHNAWAEIDKRYRGPLLRYGNKRLGEWADSEEAVQTTFSNAFQNVLQFRGNSSFLTEEVLARPNRVNHAGLKR